MTTTTSITRAVPLAQRPFDAFFVLFFAVHVLTAVLIDAQMLLPRALFPEALRRAVTWHVETSGDFLVGSPQPWFLSLVISQFLLHVPFFLVAIYAFCTGRLQGVDPRAGYCLLWSCYHVLWHMPCHMPHPTCPIPHAPSHMPHPTCPTPHVSSLVPAICPSSLISISPHSGREWIRVPAIAYSGHAITNMCIPPCTVLLSLCRPCGLLRKGPAMSLATPSWPTATSCSTAPSCALCHLLLHRPFLCPLPPPAPPPLPVPTATSCSTAPSCALCHLLLHRPFLCPLPPPAPPPLPVPSATLSQARPHSLYPHIPILSEIALNPKPLVHPSVAAGHLPPLLALPCLLLSIASLFSSPSSAAPYCLSSLSPASSFLQIPILSEIALSSSPWSTRQKLLAVYLPFLAVPCLLLARVTLPSSLFHKKFVHAKKRL
ncbi:unnamed protein product [Closterium sp. NIES-64]|nr:unnamed protein product [Closterium sp. NIES-64]